VPLQLRYNITNWVGAGAGTILSFDAYTGFNNRELVFMEQQPNPTPIIVEKKYSTSKWFSNFDGALFADIQLGTGRGGPVVGVRLWAFG